MQLGETTALTKIVVSGGAVLASSVFAWSSEPLVSLFSQLRSQEFRERELAQAELLAWARSQPESAMTELLRLSHVADDPEVRQRCLDVLRDLVIDEYLKEGEGFIGIAMKDEVSEVPGDSKKRNVIRVTEVRAGTPGQSAGIRLNDLVVGVDGEVWREADASMRLREKIRTMKPNTKVKLNVLRDGGLIELKIILGRRPLLADNPFLNGPNFDPDASERAAKEAYFRRWLSQRRGRK